MKAVVLNVHKRRGNKYGVDLEVEVPEDFAAAAEVMQALAWVKVGAVVALRMSDIPIEAPKNDDSIPVGVDTSRVVTGPLLSFEHPAAERTEPASAFASPTVCGIEASNDPTLRCAAIKGHMKGKHPADHNFVKVAAP